MRLETLPFAVVRPSQDHLPSRDYGLNGDGAQAALVRHDDRFPRFDDLPSLCEFRVLVTQAAVRARCT